MSAPNPPCVTGQAVPSVMDYSTRAGPDGNCTNVVPNPHQYPYGIGIPAPAPPVAKQAAPMDPKVQFAASRVAPPAYVQNAAAPIGGAAPPQVQQASHPVSMGKVLDALSGQREAQLVKASDADIQALFAMKDRTHTRDVFVEMRYSEEQAAEDCSCVTRKLENPDVLKFTVKDASGKKIRIGDLTTGMLLNIRVKDAFSSGHSTVGLNISGVGGRVYTTKGKRFPLILGHKQSMSFKTGRVIHQVTDIEGIHRAERLGHITEESLQSHVLPVPEQVAKGASYLLVASPLTAIIRANQATLKMNLDEISHVDGVWYMMENKIINAARRLLKRDYLDKIPTQNLGQLTFSLERAEGDWGDMSGIAVANPKQEQLLKFARQKPNHFRAQLEVQWILAKRGDC